MTNALFTTLIFFRSLNISIHYSENKYDLHSYIICDIRCSFNCSFVGYTLNSVMSFIELVIISLYWWKKIKMCRWNRIWYERDNRKLYLVYQIRTMRTSSLYYFWFASIFLMQTNIVAYKDTILTPKHLCLNHLETLSWMWQLT